MKLPELSNGLTLREVLGGPARERPDGDVFMVCDDCTWYGRNCHNYDRNHECKEREVFEHRYLCFSDYSGCMVERSNVRAMLEIAEKCGCEHVRQVYGDMGTEALWIATECNHEEMIETLQGLENYPLIDEELHSEMEVEAQDEAWDNYVKRDFEAELAKKFTFSDWEITDAAAFFDYFRRLCDDSNTYWECETGGGMYIDLKRVVDEAEIDDLTTENGIEPWRYRAELFGRELGLFSSLETLGDFVKESARCRGRADLTIYQSWILNEDGEPERLDLPGVDLHVGRPSTPEKLGEYWYGIVVTLNREYYEE